MPNYKRKDLTLKDQIGLAAVATLGRSVAKTAYLMAYPDTKSNEKSLGVLLSRWLNDDQAKEFMTRVKQGCAQSFVNVPPDSNDLTTRDGILSELINAVKSTTGKEAISGLQSLARIQGLDKPEEGEQPDPRRFFVAWKSDCRRCELMRLFRQVQAENKKS